MKIEELLVKIHDKVKKDCLHRGQIGVVCTLTDGFLAGTHANDFEHMPITNFQFNALPTTPISPNVVADKNAKVLRELRWSAINNDQMSVVILPPDYAMRLEHEFDAILKLDHGEVWVVKWRPIMEMPTWCKRLYQW